ncbi:hypothetical protein F5Y01DRAFT_319200 [Xylaria sp. FL0043]|nr:hypothetical protein F5Y01DRAFT_319200 [Xylaria sp. FL0043]
MPAAFKAAPEIPIAMCGMGMRLPREIYNNADLYSFLVSKGDARELTPKGRFDMSSYYNAHNEVGRINTEYGQYLDDVDFLNFDRLLSKVVCEALESAGEGEFRGKDISSFVGIATEDWQDFQNKDIGDFVSHQTIGKWDFMLAKRIAYEQDLRGLK